ncbi:MAG: hypothetical protein WEB88_08750 [Gemmatimonadota bacterium]
MIDLIATAAIFMAAMNIHELGHLLEARRRGARIGYVGWVLLPGLLLLAGSEARTRFQIGLPKTVWGGPHLTIEDEVRIYRTGPAMALAVAVLLVPLLYLYFTPWVFALAAACAGAGVFPLLGIGTESDGAQIRALKRTMKSTGEER